MEHACPPHTALCRSTPAPAHACMHAMAEQIKWRLKITFAKMLLLKTANVLSNELHIIVQTGRDTWKVAGAQVSC
jgi:hypothetical protein